MSGSVMPCQIDHEAFDHGIGQPSGLEQLPDIKHIPRVLAIQGGDQFACIEFVRGENRHRKFDPEQIASAGTQRSALDGQHRATEHHIDLDLDLAGFVLDDQLGVAKVFASDQPCLYAKAFDTLRDGCQLLVDIQ